VCHIHRLETMNGSVNCENQYCEHLGEWGFIRIRLEFCNEVQVLHLGRVLGANSTPFNTLRFFAMTKDETVVILSVRVCNRSRGVTKRHQSKFAKLIAIFHCIYYPMWEKPEGLIFLP
jgi:hypothetical protein